MPRHRFQEVVVTLSGYLWDVNPNGVRKVYRLKESPALPLA
ncbi:MAG: hypothetical protein WGN25_13860 [Candidatus Electrothrix sp. GW3-4]